MARRVAVVGAGYAGMAAAVTLAQRGAQAVVFESGPLPGGRARRVTTVGRTLETMLGGRQVTRFKQGGKQYDVIVQVADIDRQNPDDLASIYVRSHDGVMIPMNNIIKVTERVAPKELNHFNKLRSATITATIAPGYTLGDALTFLQETAARVLPASAQTRRNVIFILSDDHRYDFMSFMPGAPPFLRTPALDRMAKQGAHVQNALVTLSTSAAAPQVFIASVPNLLRMYEVNKSSASARLTWALLGICKSMLANPTSTKAVDVERRAAVQQRVNEYNQALAEACAAYAWCRYDGGAVANYAFTRADISTRDYFHPSLSGQANLAAITWPRTQWAS